MEEVSGLPIIPQLPLAFNRVAEAGVTMEACDLYAARADAAHTAQVLARAALECDEAGMAALHFFASAVAETDGGKDTSSPS